LTSYETINENHQNIGTVLSPTVHPIGKGDTVGFPGGKELRTFCPQTLIQKRQFWPFALLLLDAIFAVAHNPLMA